ncbi:MAG: TIGR02147 family protein [Bdellovibrionales bacterium]
MLTVPMARNESFRNFLLSELNQRIKNNQGYSLRAFAEHLDVPASSLSQILSGKRKLTDKSCLKMADSPGLSPKQTQKMMGLKLSSTVEHRKQISEDSFNVISDWHHYAILELMHVKNFRPDMNWIARVLNIPASEVRAAVERLERLKFITVYEDHWVDVLGEADNMGLQTTNGAYRKMQRQVLEKAIDALENTPYEERIQFSRTLEGSPEKIKLAKKRIQEVLDELGLLMKKPGNNEEVYHLGISLYPVSNARRTK